MLFQLTEPEWAVMQALWQGKSMTLGQITTTLEPIKHWSRNTVHTYLTRMEGKGLVSIHRETDPHLYQAAVDRDLCASGARNTLLERVYDGAAGDLIAAFLKESSITSQERERLRKLLDEMEV